MLAFQVSLTTHHSSKCTAFPASPLCFSVHTKSICIHNLIFLSIRVPIMPHLVGFTIPTHSSIHVAILSLSLAEAVLGIAPYPPSLCSLHHLHPFSINLFASAKERWQANRTRKSLEIFQETRICNLTPWPPLLSAPRLPPASCRHRSPPWAARPWSQAPLLVSLSLLFFMLCNNLGMMNIADNLGWNVKMSVVVVSGCNCMWWECGQLFCVGI